MSPINSTTPSTAAMPPPPPPTTARDPVDVALAAMRKGGFAIVVNHEQEGALIAKAESATEHAVAFLRRHTTGHVCVPALSQRLYQSLQLPQMENSSLTIPIDFKHGTSTGASAADQARTIRAIADTAMSASRFTRPGHVFPVVAEDGGVLVRAGHAEAAVNLARLAGTQPVGFCCELTDDDGRLMRRPQLEGFAKLHGLPLITIDQLVRYRVCNERLVERLDVGAPVDTPVGEFQARAYRSLVRGDDQRYDVLTFGDVAATKRDVAVYFVDTGFTSSIHAQWAQKQIVDRYRAGILIYVNEVRKFLKPSDERMMRQSVFGIGMQIVHDLGAESIVVLTSEPAAKRLFDPHGFRVDIARTEIIQKRRVEPTHMAALLNPLEREKDPWRREVSEGMRKEFINAIYHEVLRISMEKDKQRVWASAAKFELKIWSISTDRDAYVTAMQQRVQKLQRKTPLAPPTRLEQPPPQAMKRPAVFSRQEETTPMAIMANYHPTSSLPSPQTTPAQQLLERLPAQFQVQRQRLLRNLEDEMARVCMHQREQQHDLAQQHTQNNIPHHERQQQQQQLQEQHDFVLSRLQQTQQAKQQQLERKQQQYLETKQRELQPPSDPHAAQTQLVNALDINTDDRQASYHQQAQMRRMQRAMNTMDLEQEPRCHVVRSLVPQLPRQAPVLDLTGEQTSPSTSDLDEVKMEFLSEDENELIM